MQTANSFLRTVAIVDYWPDIENAETECILRIASALIEQEVEPISINRHGFLLSDPNTHIDELNVDFVIALHFDSAKCWGAFTYYALWNPLDFYFQWNYREKSKNLLSNDAFLSCGSTVADDHAKRLLTGAGRTANKNFLTLYHGTHKPIIEPAVSNGKLFYCGINWEAISGTGGRHHALLKLLDQKGLVDIYGPEVFQNVRVWDGYDSYQGSIPFDGKTLISKIAKSGIGLVLSSDAHIKSGLMSSRLFECLAAGVPIICDGNPFAKRNFGDLLHYIDTTKPANEVANQIITKLEWIKSHTNEALELARKAQQLYVEKFELSKNLKTLLNNGEHQTSLPTSDRLQELYSIFIAAECDYIYLRKINVYTKYFAGTNQAKPILILPDTTSKARVDELQNLSSEIKIIFYKREASDKGKNETEIISKLFTLAEELQTHAILQVVQPYEFPSWLAIEEQWHQLSANPNLEMVSGGFTTTTNTVNRNQGHAVFNTEIRLTELFDANNAFPSSSCIFRNGFLLTTNTVLPYLPYFAFRLLYAYAHSINKIESMSKTSVTLDFDMYATRFRPNEHEAIMREVEFFSDYLGEDYVKSKLTRAISGNHANFDLNSIINNLDKNTARILIEKLYVAIKLPSFINKIITRMWSKNVL
jgi:hypothetical protein